MEKYSKAVSEMYAQFKKREVHPMEKYIGGLARCSGGGALEVVGYNVMPDGSFRLIVGRTHAWDYLDAEDVVFKRCDAYCYASVNGLID